MKQKSTKELVNELADRESIRDCLMRYCRGVDRLDTQLLDEVYWPDSEDDHVLFKGTGPEFVDYLVPTLGAMNMTMHKLGNIFIELDGSKANVESYYDATHILKNDEGTPIDLIVGGRYVDSFEKRNDFWKIRKRQVVLDWFRLYSDSGDWSARPLGMEAIPGSRKPSDQSYHIFK